ncbi:cytochrome c [Thioclava sp. 15-R06ZXC-3]|uniref:Cytochrome c n=1 Tax=Thioclava arctica TaxID=3238301 RepID=A0ABV3THH8_9RHOB
MNRLVHTTSLSLSLALALATLTTTALAKDIAKDPIARARMELMDQLGQNLKIIGDMATKKTPFDATAAAAATSTLRADAAKVTDAFEQNTSDPASKALPRLWDNEGEFWQKTRRLQKAADALDPSSASGLADGLNALGASCKDCHGRFKAD